MISRVGTLQTNGVAVNGGNVTIAMPVGIQDGDVAIVFGGHPHRAASPLGPSTSGYTEVHIHTAAAPNVGAWYKVMGASPDANVALQGSGNTDDGTAYVGYVLRGVDPGTVEDVISTFAGPTTGTNPNPPAITPATDGALVISFAGSTVNDPTVGNPVGFTDQVINVANDVVDITVAGALLEDCPGGVAVDPGAWGETVASWGSGDNYRITMAIRPIVEEQQPSFDGGTGVLTDQAGPLAGPFSNGGDGVLTEVA
jgi:hypothetical protein